MIKLPTKMPAEVWRCLIDVTAWTVDNNAIASVTTTAPGGSLVVSGVSLLSPTEVVFLLSGGNVKTTYKFSILATMNDGQVFGEELSVVVFE